ncbi:MAG TPA: D-aminoacylase [Edaphobacter sp.]|jgi:N-acyl-D-aspartate/D-glutamate deacylase|nr:D-aminoacylase [Edaphobacter sp.]
MNQKLNLTIAATLMLLMRSFAPAQNPAQPIDLIIRGGSLIDGSGTPAIKADIGISGDRIVFVGSSAGKKAKREIDATGLVVTPGFIDPHTHTAGDLSDAKRSRNDAYLMQGVSTIATGNDGDSPAAIGATLAKWNQKGIGTNAVLFIGQGTVRREVMGMADTKPTPEQMDRMKSLVEAAMNEGAIGISTGLYYAPGSFSSTEEVIELARVAAHHGGIYDTHMRDESSYTIGLLGSVRETIRIGREAHLPVMISHIKALGADVWGKSADVIALIDNARKAGVNVTASQYPYTASGTSVTAALIPRWAEADGALLKNLSDSSLHQRLTNEIEQNLVRRGGADSLLMTASRDPTIVGKTLAAIARERNESPVDAAIEIVKAGGSDVASFNMKENDIEAFMRQPWVMTCSDGSPGHPRKYGTYPRKLRLYVYERHVIPLEFAIRSSTSLPAKTLGLKDRGLLKPGYFADVLVFDPRTFNERATYQAPTILSTGVQYLMVNGQLAIDKGSLTAALAGRAIKH